MKRTVQVEAFRQGMNNGRVPWFTQTLIRTHEGDTLRAFILTWMRYRVIVSVSHVKVTS